MPDIPVITSRKWAIDVVHDARRHGTDEACRVAPKEVVAQAYSCSRLLCFALCGQAKLGIYHDVTPQALHDPICGLPVPKIGTLANSHWARQDIADFRFQSFEIYETIAALADCNWPLGVLTQSQTWNAKVGSFLLNTARIGEHKSCRRNCAHEFDIAKRRQQPQVSDVAQPRQQALRLPAAGGCGGAVAAPVPSGRQSALRQRQGGRAVRERPRLLVDVR